ncbi:MAG: phenylalanine 4-monooxygenase [Pseudomonadota bacterium]
MPTRAKKPPAGAAADWTIPQRWEDYSAEEHALWDQLVARQCALLTDRAAPQFLQGLDILRLAKPGIPEFESLSERLTEATGWKVVAAPGLVPDEVFFQHLANRCFVAGRFLRKPEEMDYLQEPDIFHDVFGHVPMLTHPVFADYMQAYGEGGLRALRLGSIERLARLYWYTVEFGLLRVGDEFKLYGSGIVSSHGESLYALDDLSPHRLGFDMRRVMRTRYRIDDYQQTYFVIESFDDLLKQTLQTDFAPLYEELKALPDLDGDALLPEDKVYTRGTQDDLPTH